MTTTTKKKCELPWILFRRRTVSLLQVTSAPVFRAADLICSAGRPWRTAADVVHGGQELTLWRNRFFAWQWERRQEEEEEEGGVPLEMERPKFRSSMARMREINRENKTWTATEWRIIKLDLMMLKMSEASLHGFTKGGLWQWPIPGKIPVDHLASVETSTSPFSTHIYIYSHLSVPALSFSYSLFFPFFFFYLTHFHYSWKGRPSAAGCKSSSGLIARGHAWMRPTLVPNRLSFLAMTLIITNGGGRWKAGSSTPELRPSKIKSDWRKVVGISLAIALFFERRSSTFGNTQKSHLKIQR